MAGLTWQRRGAQKRQLAHARLDAQDIALAIEERHEYDGCGLGYSEWDCYDCGDYCDMCIPDWRERDERLRQLNREQPPFTFAERILAQVGLVLRQVAA